MVAISARRLVAVGGVAAAFAVAQLIVVAPTMAVLAGPGPAIGTPMAQCPQGEQLDPLTNACAALFKPSPSPGDVGQQWVEQDVTDTPGLSPGAGGTTVP